MSGIKYRYFVATSGPLLDKLEEYPAEKERMHKLDVAFVKKVKANNLPDDPACWNGLLFTKGNPNPKWFCKGKYENYFRFRKHITDAKGKLLKQEFKNIRIPRPETFLIPEDCMTHVFTSRSMARTTVGFAKGHVFIARPIGDKPSNWSPDPAHELREIKEWEYLKMWEEIEVNDHKLASQQEGK